MRIVLLSAVIVRTLPGVGSHRVTSAGGDVSMFLGS